MSKGFRKLNDEGVHQFSEYLAGGAIGAAPIELLDNPESSDGLETAIYPGTASFTDRFQFGVYLKTFLAPFDPTVIAGDRNFWTSLALLWFDKLCPPAKGEEPRDLKESYRYVLSGDYRHYYRHLVRSPWQLVRMHGKNAQFLLIAPQQQTFPLSVHGEILEQFGGRQQVLASRSIIDGANRMYFDASIGRPRKGVAGSGRGSARRFGLVLRQLDLTYDSEVMPDGALLKILPTEFERWKPKSQSASSSQPVGAGAPAAV